MIEEVSKSKDRLPPSSIEAEEYLLSCALIDGVEVMQKCMNAKMPGFAFYSPKNRIIYEALTMMHADGKPIDLATLSEEMKTAKTMEQVGGYSYLIQISSKIPTTAQVDFFIEKIMELALLRQLIDRASRVVESAYNYTGDIVQTFQGHASDIMHLASGFEATKEATWNSLIDQAEEVADQLISAKGGRPPALVINTPWPEMDDLFQPFQRGQLITIAGLTSTGKSCLLRQIAHAACVQNHKVYYDTLEVLPHQVPLQLAAMFSKIGIRQLHSSHKADQADFKAALRDLRNLGIIVTNKDTSFAQIVSRIKALKAAGKMDMFCVDYGGLIDDVANARKNDLSSEANRVFAGFKRLAAETNSVGVVPWQLNRDSAKDNREPILQDLRDAQIENHVDKAFLIHRPDEWPKILGGQAQKATTRVADMPRFFTNILQAKGRDDGISSMSFWFNRPIATFQVIEKE